MRGHSKIRSLLKGSEIDDDIVMTSIFTELEAVSVSIPINRAGEGGAMTSFKNELVVITHEGRIFLVNESGFKETAILAPDNGFGAYKKAALSDKFKDLTHVFTWFRYNDILYYFENDHDYLVLSYTEWLADDECYGTAIARLKLPANTNSLLDVKIEPTDWDIVYRTQPCLNLKSEYRAMEGHMAGGRMALYSGHKIVLGNGDYHWDGVYAPESYAQVKDNDYGKVLEIDLDSGTSKHLSLGNRNMQGVMVDDLGQIWVAEHGVRGGDELNLIENNQNYGWPNETLGTTYDNQPWPMSSSYGRHEEYVAPAYAWIPSIAVSGITQINDFHPAWDGDLLVSTLRTQKIFRIRIKGKRVLFAEPIDVGERVRYVHQHNDGKIVLWTDSKKVQFIAPADNQNIKDVLEDFCTEQKLDNSQKHKFLSSVNRCMECHEFNNYNHEKAPGLEGIYNRGIATTGYKNYSQGLHSKGGKWTRENLKAYLKDPQAFAPGTSMPDQGLEDSEALKSLIDFLEKLK
ncbi:PQQ-dependent sugar dehydrogenase [Seonamhaeicola sp.]|uniref:PQQ-dependent sugar dehydrogenase n=1 Tax=Seonamhaeicola sp. TaxID=1912245 RepID=UPI00262ACE20|nr:PQQ-dependent sugar dehydrogenase [Seonamhaeicola sp.]